MPRPKVIWAWDLPWLHPDARMIMGVQKNPNGTGYKQLNPGDEPRLCPLCNAVVSDYPHTHTKAERDKYDGD